MTLKLEQVRTQRWTALSTDGKPTSAAVGSIVYETDTNDEYIWNGKQWLFRRNLLREDFDPNTQLLEDVLDELKSMNFHLQVITGIDA